MLFKEPFISENEFGIMAGGLSLDDKENLLEKDQYILFEPNQLTIKESNMAEASILYTKDFSLQGFTQAEEVVNEISRQWFKQNKIFIVMIFSVMISAFLFVIVLFLTLGSAFFLYLTKDRKSTRLNSSHVAISYAVFCLKKKSYIEILDNLK